MSFRDRLLRFLSLEPAAAEANNNVFSFAPPPSATDAAKAAEEEEINGLNFRTAIEAHQKWKSRLTDYIAHRSTETLEALVISRDDQCVLGKWIHGAGQQAYGHVPRFTELRQAHAIFHQCAGDIVHLFQTGRAAQAQALLESGPYTQNSVKVCNLLARLYLELQAKAA